MSGGRLRLAFMGTPDFAVPSLAALIAAAPDLKALQAEYEALWIPVLTDLHTSGALRAPVGLARLLLLGALNWSVQWFDPRKSATVADLTDAAMALFVGHSQTST